MREDAREFMIVDIGTIHGMVHLIPEWNSAGWAIAGLI